MEKTLDLKMFGVLELSREELKTCDGGFVLTGIFPFISDAAEAVGNWMQGFVDGYRDNNYKPQ